MTSNGVDDGLYTGDFSFGMGSKTLYGFMNANELPEPVSAPGGAAPAHWIFSTGNSAYFIDGSEGFMNSYAFIDTGNPVSLFVFLPLCKICRVTAWEDNQYPTYSRSRYLAKGRRKHQRRQHFV